MPRRSDAVGLGGGGGGAAVRRGDDLYKLLGRAGRDLLRGRRPDRRPRVPSAGTEDNSGDYTDYPAVTELTVGTVTAELRGRRRSANARRLDGRAYAYSLRLSGRAEHRGLAAFAGVRTEGKGWSGRTTMRSRPRRPRAVLRARSDGRARAWAGQEGQWLHLRLLGEPYRVSPPEPAHRAREDSRWLPADGFADAHHLRPALRREARAARRGDVEDHAGFWRSGAPRAAGKRKAGCAGAAVR